MGTVTDVDGAFSVTLPPDAKYVKVSYIGYEPVTLVARNGMQVRLSEEQNELDEVIVTGYGNFKKTSFTGGKATRL